MRLIERIEGVAPAAGRPRTTRRQDLISAGLATWLVVGGGVDGWAHREFGNRIETFFTPWHAMLYSGFIAVSSWMLFVCVRSWRRSRTVPAGYGLGLVGAVVFGIGGAADMVWHVVFGIEVNIEALLSPTHIVLFLGAMMLLTTPFRAAWLTDDPPRAPRLGAFFPVLISIALTTLEVGFFFQYLSAQLGDHPGRGLYRFLSEVLDPRNPGWQFQELWTMRIMAQLLVTNVIFVAPVLLILRRWRPPTGSLTLLLGLEGLFVCGLDGFRMPALILPLVVGGLMGDVLVRAIRPEPSRPGAFRLTAALIPAAMWSAYFAVVQARFGGVAWAAELWTGAIIFNALAGYALALFMVPPREPVEPEPTSV